MILEKECWKKINSEENYQISNFGRVKNVKTNRILKPNLMRNGYLKIHLYKHGKRSSFFIHRLVALAFVPNPKELPQVNHIDENKSNNLSSNLEWVSAKENVNYGQRNYKNSVTRGFTVQQFTLKEKYIKEYHSVQEASRLLNIPATSISNVCRGVYSQTGGYRWRYKT